MFSAGAGVFFAGAGAGGEKPGVCTALTPLCKSAQQHRSEGAL